MRPSWLRTVVCGAAQSGMRIEEGWPAALNEPVNPVVTMFWWELTVVHFASTGLGGVFP